MRAFLGVPVPATPALEALLGELRECRADLKVVRPEQTHLTLKFLGDVPAETATRFLCLIRAEPLPAAFDLEVRDVGAFPNWKHATVLWAGIVDPAGGLTRLFLAAEKAWAGLGQPSEGRAFVPHLTLARTRSQRGLAQARTALETHRGGLFGGCRVGCANLYESTLTPGGPVYRVVEEVVLPRA